jgi:hypothetical protein
MTRLLATVVLAFPAISAAAPRAVGEDPAYLRANARVARIVPHYPRARLLIQEPMGGEVGAVPFEAVQRVSFLARPQTRATVMRFYVRQLGPTWRRRGTTCLVSGRRVVVAVVYPPRRRLGVLVDSRGASRCGGLTGIVGDLLHAGYPDS